jgi:hypothetical protein
MRLAATTFACLATVIASVLAPAPLSPASGPTFDVVSIKKHVAQPGPLGLNSSVNQRPDGGFMITLPRCASNRD